MASDKETPFDTLTVREAMNRVGLQIFTGQWNGKEYLDHWKLGLNPWPPTKLRGMEAVRELLRLIWDRTVIVEREIQDGMYQPIQPNEVLHFHGPSSSVAGEAEVYQTCRLRFPKTESKPMTSNGGRRGYDYPPIAVRILRYMDEHGVGASIEQVTFAVIDQIEKEGGTAPSHSKIQPYVSALRAYRCSIAQKFPESIRERSLATNPFFAANNTDLDTNNPRSTMSNPIVLDRVGLRRCGIHVVNSTLINWEKKGLFPRRFRIGACVYWDQKSIEEHLARLAAEASQ